MRSVWQIDGNDIYSLQGKSADFVRLLNALLAAQGQRGGLTDSEILLNQKDTVPDGGVDAAVSKAIPAAQDPTGWLNVPSCWQFKAQPTSNIKPSSKAPNMTQEAALREEINKPYAAELVKKGFGYRLCIADDMPATTKAKWENWLNDEAKMLNPAAAPAFVVTASDLALWVNRYPAIVLRFRPAAYQLKTFPVWQGEVRGLTPSFVKPSSWPEVLALISNHVKFGQKVDKLLTIQGEAGVGKTRLTCEALSGDPAIEALVAATSDEQAALEFAQAVASDPSTQAILVTDECSLKYRERLRQILPGCHDRLRIIAIDNSLQRAGMSGEIRILQMSPKEVLEVLDTSFPDLPPDRRRSFAQLARGFVRLAVDLCQHDHLLPQDGRLVGVFGHFEDSYLVSRLKDDELTAVQLVSLLPRVGYRDDVANELQQLCTHPAINRDPRQVVEIATRLKQSPGFIAFGGRYLYVTPTLIAQVAFQSAWAKWVAPDPPGFLRKLSPNLLDGFVEQTRRAPNPEFAGAVSSFFLQWVKNLGPPDLAVETTIIRLVHLIETDPDLFLPLLKGLLDGIPSNELQALHSKTLEGQNARRQLVWLAEKLAHLPDYFSIAEDLLLKLALAETEQHLGNSATRVWTAMFRIVLSGTPIPFLDRLDLLERRLREAQGTQLPLAVSAFDEILTDGPVMSLAGPPVILGRVPPPVWRPTDTAERQSYRRTAMEMAARLCSEEENLGEVLRTAVVDRLSPLLLAGCLEQVQTIIGPKPIPDQLLAALTRELEEFTSIFCRESSVTVQRRQPKQDGGEELVAVKEIYPRKVSVELEARIRDWYAGLIPETLHGKIVSVVGRDSWQQEVAGDRIAWQKEMDEVAMALISSPADFDREISWLSSEEARSSFHLGQSLGKMDEAGSLLERVFEAARLGAIGVVRGYLDLASTHPPLLDRLNAALDKLQGDDPRTAFNVLWSAGPKVRKVERVIGLVDAGHIPADFLRSLEREVHAGELDWEQFAGAVSRTISAAEGGNPKAAVAAVKLLYSRVHPNRQVSGTEQLNKELALVPLLRSALATAMNSEYLEPTFWLTLAEDLATIDADAGAELLAKAITSSDYNTRQLAESHLADLAASKPAEVMKALGNVFLHPDDGIWLQISNLSALVNAIPLATLKGWIDHNGLPAARAIARHLVPPYLDNGATVVPPLTAHVLGQFEEDELVFQEFLAGAHSGQVYSGDIAAQYLGEAQVAQRFTGHSLRRIREWAVAEIEDARKEAEFWRQRAEEDNTR